VVEDNIVKDLLRWQNLISFGGGLPDPALFPLSELKEIVNRVIDEQGPRAFEYAPTEGIDELREEVLRFKGFRDTINNVMITAGSQEALDLLIRILLKPGDVVVVERPTYFVAVKLLRRREARIIDVPIRDDGIDAESLKDAVKRYRPRLIYVMPNFQNPSGVTMSEEKRRLVIDLAEEIGSVVIEDDPYSYLNYGGPLMPHLRELSDNVVYVSTFSKVVVPGLRVGFVVAPENIVKSLSDLKQLTTISSPTLSQLIIYKVLRDGYVEKFLSRYREAYKVKRDAMLSALSEHMPEGAYWTKPMGGMFVWLTVPGISFSSILNKAINEYGIAYVPGSNFCIEPSDCDESVRLNFTYTKLDNVNEGVRRLGVLIKRTLGYNEQA